jgi:ubiquitin-conjugating enzyme E2 C
MCRRKLEHRFDLEDEEMKAFPVRIDVTLVRIPGPIMRDNKIHHIYTHKFTLEITDEYPYQKPIVRWQSPIFHPNIMNPEEGGYVCTKLLDVWSFDSNLLAFIKGLESLISNPNPASPYASARCMEAARYFYEHPYKPPEIVTTTRKLPKIIVSK